MSGGCTDCGRKGGCDHRKAGMFGAIDEALARLYPDRRWGNWDEAAAFRQGVAPDIADRLAEALARRLDTVALVRPGDDHEYCDYVYALCVGRQPSLIELREGAASLPVVVAEAVDGTTIDELYLRVALSALAPFAAVQQVAMRLELRDGEVILTEAPRSGVFDPILLPRMQKVVAALAELEVRHLDFGDLTQPPEGFDDADYPDRYGGRAALANYLFFPQPAAAQSRIVLPLPAAGAAETAFLRR